MDIDIFPGFTASNLIYKDNKVRGIVTGDMGISSDGEKKDSFEPGIELVAKITVLAEGCRGHLGKQVIKKLRTKNNPEKSK